MVPFADASKPVLWMGSARDFASPPRSPYFLWPVYEFKALVLETRRESDSLDPFERAALGASAAGMHTTSELARTLGLNEDFLAQVLTRLVGRGLLDVRGRPTRLARQTPAGAQHDEDRPVVVYVYRDAYTGQLWPRVARVEGRIECEVDYDERGSPAVILGTKGDPRRITAFQLSIPSKATAASPPDAADVQRALVSHRKMAAVAGARGYRGIPRAGSISILGQDATAVYLVGYAIRQHSRQAEDLCLAADPFGLGTLPSFERWVTARANEFPAFRTWLGADPSFDPSDTNEDEEVEEVELALEHCRFLLDAVDADQNEAARRQLVTRMRDLTVIVLGDHWERRPLETPHRVLTGTPATDGALIEQLARQAGFASAGGLRVDELAEAATNGIGTPRLLLASLLLGYPVDRMSPIVQLGAEFEDLFDLLAMLDESGQVDRPVRPSPARLRRTFDAIVMMHRLLYVPLEGSSSDDVLTDAGRLA